MNAPPIGALTDHLGRVLVRAATYLLPTLITLVPVSAAGDGPEGAVCIRAWKEAPYRNFGHDHIVAVHNGCDRPLRCTVSTNVSPKRYLVSIRVDRTARVLTFRGAPTKEFAARVQCRAAE